jgi:hypothetical protein
LSETDEGLLGTDVAPGAETRRFTPGELLTCDSCLRANAPTRTQCLYCGAELEPAGSALPPELPLPDRNRVYVVARLRSGQSIANAVVDRLAETFQFKPAELQAGISTAAPLPLTSASPEQATQLLSELQEYGLETFSIQESEVQTSPANTKIRSLEFSETTLSALTTSPAQNLRADWSDLALIVSGRLQTNRVEVDERQSRNSIKHLDRRELSQDETVIDLYMKSETAWRIGAHDFDFSALGEQKSLTAFDNLRALIDVLTRRSGAELNDAYARIRPLLAVTWPLETASSKARSRRPRASRKDVSVVTATDNTAQFNNYSRLAWMVKHLELEGRLK